MTAASYTTDLSAQTITAADAAASYAEATATGWTDAGTTTQPDTDVFIQGTGSATYPLKTGIGAALANAGSPVTVPTDGAYLIWIYHAAPNTLATEANGGMRMIAGDSLAAFIGWKVGGSDTYTYGGWQNIACDPAQTKDYTAGAPTEDGVYQYVGFAFNQTGTVNRGNPMVLDALRYGRCELRINGGTSPDAAASFVGAAAQNDNISNRWGLLQAVAGGYLWKGLLTLGYTSAVRFTAANAQILIDNTKRVSANFNKIEIRQATSEINWTGISFLALGTASKGRLEVVDDCDVNISGCTFTGMDTFIFKAASAVLNSIFRACGIITANGANFAGTLFEGYEGAADSSYLVWDVNTDPGALLAGCQFTKGGAATHAITFGTTSPTDINLPNTVVFSGYNANDGQNDSAVYIARDTGTVTIHYDGEISYKSAGATVVIAASQIDVTLTGMKDNTEVRVYSAGTTTELAGIENATSGTTNNRSFTFSLGAATQVDIRIFCVGYQPADILGYTVPAANASVPVSQVFDRVYANA